MTMVSVDSLEAPEIEYRFQVQIQIDKTRLSLNISIQKPINLIGKMGSQLNICRFEVRVRQSVDNLNPWTIRHGCH